MGSCLAQLPTGVTVSIGTRQGGTGNSKPEARIKLEIPMAKPTRLLWAAPRLSTFGAWRLIRASGLELLVWRSELPSVPTKTVTPLPTLKAPAALHIRTRPGNTSADPEPGAVPMAEKSVSTESFATEKKDAYTGEKFRVAFIGCGGISHTHLGALTTMPEVEIVAGVDVDPRPAQGLGREVEGREALRPTGRPCSARSSPTGSGVCTPQRRPRPAGHRRPSTPGPT